MIGFYFSGSGGKLQLPVNPEKLKIVRKGANQKAEIVALGEINILRNAKLKETAFEFLLPGADYYPFIVGDWKKPKTIIDYFDKLQGKGNSKSKSVRFTVTELGINMRVSVEDFDYSYIAGDHESVKCSISLCEYKYYGARTLYIPPKSTAKAVSNSSVRPSDKPQETTYTVKSGDNLWLIAQRHYGTGSRNMDIFNLNKSTITNPNHIEPGWVLKLPAR